MSRLNSTDNPDPIIKEKMNFFIDNFNHFITYAGSEKSFEIETPLTIIEKILSHIPGDAKYRIRYLDNYINSKWLIKREFIGNFSSFQSIQNDINTYQTLGKSSTDKEYKNTILNSIKFQENLKKLKHELEYKMILKIVYILKEILTNKITLYEDNLVDKIINYTSILVSEYFFSNRTHGEIEEIITNIISKDINKFPFPKGMKNIHEKKKFIADLNINTQLDGLSNILFLKPYTHTVLIKVFGATFPDDFTFEYNKIKFWSPNNPKFVKIKEKFSSDNYKTYSFFDNQNYIIATTEISYFSDESLNENAVNVIKKGLIG